MDDARMADEPFWRTTPLAEMTREQWESLCDGCGRCCLIKLQDEDGEGDEVDYTDVACRLLDLGLCRCTRYAERKRLVPGCVVLTPANLDRLPWMPSTCAYRLVAEGKDLPWWHHLVSGDPEDVHRAGISVRGRVVPETRVEEEDLEDHIVEWPR